MSRRILYKIPDDGRQRMTEKEWDEIQRLQHWYNSEFVWSSGKIAMKKYALFPNMEEFGSLDETVWQIIDRRERELKRNGATDLETVAQLEQDGLVFVKWGGYFDRCLASGLSRVADNEWNAFLVCDFLLKASTICVDCRIDVEDEGQFIRTRSVSFAGGSAIVSGKPAKTPFVELLVQDRKLFSVVDADKYSNHPSFTNTIYDFNHLTPGERRALVQNWNWLGYGSCQEERSESRKGFNLNEKVRSFILDP